MTPTEPPAARPLILLTNDDGYNSPGLQALWEALDTDYDTVVVAPARQRSWIGKALSNPGPLRLVEKRVGDKVVTAVDDGTPADCVNLALFHVLPRKPAHVISGINLGSNFTSSLALASGTIGAALEAALHGVFGLAVNLALDEHSERELQGTWHAGHVKRFEPAARALAQFLREVVPTLDPAARLVNLVVPDPLNEPPHFKACEPLAYEYGSVFVPRDGGYVNRGLGFIESQANIVLQSDVWAVRNGWCAYTCYTGYLERVKDKHNADA